MKSVKVTLRGISPLLMHAFPMVPIEGIEKMSPEEQAKTCLYQLSGNGSKVYVPGVNLQRAFVNGGAFSKGKGRATLTKIVAASVFVEPDALIIKPQTWVVDSRPVVIAATRGRIVRHRPRFDNWEIECNIAFDEVLMKEKELRKIVDDTGSRVGLLDFSPRCKGPFGRFMVTAWDA